MSAPRGDSIPMYNSKAACIPCRFLIFNENSLTSCIFGRARGHRPYTHSPFVAKLPSHLLRLASFLAIASCTPLVPFVKKCPNP